MSKPYDSKKYRSKNLVAQALLFNFETKLIKLIESVSVKTLLDAGCGEGYLLRVLHERLLAPPELNGFELVPELLEQAKIKLPAAQLWEDNIYASTCKDEAYELVVCTEVLEHLEDPGKALSELFRISSRYVIVSVPHEPFFRLSSLLRGKYLKQFGNHPGHLQLWGRSGFLDLVKAYGTVVAIASPFPWTMVLAEKSQLELK
ncbi:MAG TPA: class I SAM-dependent methyltransferase [Candidatus Margulisbacteria bacterium]|nr:MAG: hypothetical protein A2X43_02385 [Candidatus Margulisbacteria bacterium GWD2_39_127]HAR62380.1 class I SAM-dependent methyltransferase [Candidatus Margulisiibacteriota bacterium]